ncbi:MAG: metallophosphoesterase [Clostridium sp.]|nr:metallophosphoesterase [Clostridium sp.]
MKFYLNILTILCILGVVCLFLVFIVSHMENRKLTVTRYQIRDALIPQAFNGYHIVQLSDLHNACFGENNAELIHRIKELQPDIILITGDMIIGKPGEPVDIAVDTVNALSGIAQVYFSMGNHELRASLYTDVYGDMWERFLKGLLPGVHLLLDDKTLIHRGDDKIWLYGLNLSPDLYRRFILKPMPSGYLSSLFGECDPEEYHILMAHHPDYFQDYAAWGANLTFSGHVHGGMIYLPLLGGVLSPMIHFFPKYDKGLFTDNNKNMILSGGLGNHTFKFRVNNLPEIVSVTLYQETI